VKISDRVMIPQDLHPEINFVGLLIGPRGNTLKMLEKETGAKVRYRSLILQLQGEKFLQNWSIS
jgi:splicing factor 1